MSHLFGRLGPTLGFVCLLFAPLLAVGQEPSVLDELKKLAADEADAAAEANQTFSASTLPSTHAQIGTIALAADGGQCIVNTFCMDGAGRLLVAVGGWCWLWSVHTPWAADLEPRLWLYDLLYYARVVLVAWTLAECAHWAWHPVRRTRVATACLAATLALSAVAWSHANTALGWRLRVQASTQALAERYAASRASANKGPTNTMEPSASCSAPNRRRPASYSSCSAQPAITSAQGRAAAPPARRARAQPRTRFSSPLMGSSRPR